MPDAYPPVGQCIYCGATEYAPGSSRSLATEHVIPYALGGDILLPEASCQTCERVTGRIESIGLNAHLLSARRAMGLHSRTPKAKQKAQSLSVVKDGLLQDFQFPDEDYPSVLFLPYFNEAPILRELPYRGHPNDMMLGIYYYFFDQNAQVLLSQIAPDALISPPLDTLVWRRMIAKIAHATAVAELGMKAFAPLLSEVLLDPNRHAYDVQDYVGGSPIVPRTRTGHNLTISREIINGQILFVVDVTLFSVLDAPSYRVAVGYEVGAKQPVLPRKRPIILNLQAQGSNSR